MRTTLICLLLLTFYLGACTNRDPKDTAKYKPDAEAKEYHKKAALMLNRNQVSDDSSKKALAYLDTATMIDSNFIVAYMSKLTILSRISTTSEGMKVVDKILNINPDLGSILMYKGFLLERQGDRGTADQYYNKAYRAISKRIEISPTIGDKANLAMLVYLIKGKEAAITEYKNLLKEYPKNASGIKTYLKVLAETPNREVFIKNNIKYLD